MTSVKLYALHAHFSVDLLQSHFIDAEPSMRSKCLNKIVCVDSGNRESPHTLQKDMGKYHLKALAMKEIT